jgi:hypothetical protein
MSIPVDGFEDAADRPILLKLGASQLEFQGKSYLLTFACRTSSSTLQPPTTSSDIVTSRSARAISSVKSGDLEY